MLTEICRRFSKMADTIFAREKVEYIITDQANSFIRVLLVSLQMFLVTAHRHKMKDNPKATRVAAFVRLTTWK